MKNILVLCTGNSCRSQIAEGYLKKFVDDKATVYSAGIETHGLNPAAVATMQRDGINITNHTSNNVEEYQGISVCDHAYENCPFIPAPGAQRLHHNFYDPSKFKGTPKETEAAFDTARDEIKDYCSSFIENNL
jgi:arsenate reductase